MCLVIHTDRALLYIYIITTAYYLIIFKQGLRDVFEAGLDKCTISPSPPILRWNFAELIRLGIEGSRRPTDVTQVDIGILVEVRDLVADITLARLRVAATHFRIHGLSLVGAQPVCERREGRRDIICCAVRVRSRVVAVRVLVHVEHEPRRGVVWIHNAQEGGAALRRERSC